MLGYTWSKFILFLWCLISKFKYVAYGSLMGSISMREFSDGNRDAASLSGLLGALHLGSKFRPKVMKGLGTEPIQPNE
jgi:hypothetical protein